MKLVEIGYSGEIPVRKRKASALRYPCLQVYHNAMKITIGQGAEMLLTCDNVSLGIT